MPKGVFVWTRRKRDREILRGFSRGESNQKIAARMGLTHGTIRFYVSALFADLGAARREQALAIAVERGMFSLETNKKPC
jgi:DNA-binding NarL/FixJ family response regulator